MNTPISPSSTNSPPDVAMAADATPTSASAPHNTAAAAAAPPTDNSNCDGQKPSCSTCTRLGHDCAYDEVRRKSGPKRGYVKALEERLKQVETLLKTQDLPATTATSSAPNMPVISPPGGPTSQTDQGAAPTAAATANMKISDPVISIAKSRDADRWNYTSESPPQPGSVDEFNFNSRMAVNMGDDGSNFTWEMIGLGLEEPLPPQDTIDELHQIYFEKIHPSMPMIHKYRYLAAMNLAPSNRPPVCLRYAIWTLACSVADKYDGLKDLFYQRSRKYIEADYMKGFGEHIICVAHTQTHTLLASYELKMMYFPRAWMSTGAAVRLSQMIGLHRLDGAGLDVKQCLPPPRDWTEREERRRTFWMAFAQDRYASIGTGWPMTIDEKDILTNLPASDEAFDMSRPEQTMTLAEAMSPSGAAKLNSFGGIILMASLFGRNLTHLHRPDEEDNDHDLNGEFWKRHRAMDNILLNTSLCLPPHLKLPIGLQNPNVVYTNMCIHTSTICLHQAAIFKSEKNRLPPSVGAESKVRCITAANEIASIMRMVSHMDLSALDVDLEALTARIPKLKGQFTRSAESTTSGNQPMNKVRQGANCEEGLADHGILAYKNECFMFKAGRDDTGNPAEGPDLVDDEPSRDRVWMTTADVHAMHPPRTRESCQSTSSNSGHVPVISLTPNSPRLYNASNGSSMSFGQGDEPENSPSQGSNHQTPNSGGTPSEQHHKQSQRQRAGSFAPASQGSYDTSPIMADQGAPAGFFGTPVHNFATLAAGMSIGGTGSATDGFVVSSGWGMPATTGQHQQQQQQQPILRNLVQMAPMETMDFGWDGNSSTL
ncbi:C6 transcription factor Prf [Pyricularia oryzae]|nr:C6 transcription factor Prf [Pyricularia oryzae]KAI7931339.1 C6 transcription factor Prf [Pyricularia oryzae]